MPTARQYLSLLVVLLAGLVLVRVSGGDRTLAPAHWPAADAIYQVDGWSMEPMSVENGYSAEQSAALLQRTYRRDGLLPATLIMWTQPQPQAKTLLRKGPDRDFLGEGYLSETPPASVVPPQPGRGALIARRGQQAWLVLYAYGERRGLLDMGPLAWGLAELDAVLDRPNDYFLARILVPFNPELEPPPVSAAASLADSVFPRLAAWYGDLHADSHAATANVLSL
jgi:lambda repressor-like predicted transcriptional regulator